MGDSRFWGPCLHSCNSGNVLLMMTKKVFLESLTASLKQIPDDAVVNLSAEVVIPFSRGAEPIGIVRISGQWTEGTFLR
jgi:hypothetical protein